MPSLREARRTALTSLLAAEGVDGLIVTHLPNIHYLTGFSGSSGVLLALPGEAVLISDFRYRTQATGEVGDAVRVEIAPTDLWAVVWKTLDGYPAAERVGYESHAVTVRTAERFVAAKPRCALEPVSGLVERLRASKHPVEVERIAQAATLALEAFEETIGSIRVGASELAVAAELERALRVRGSEWHPFPTIVASGPRSALPHARTSDRRLERGDLVLLDFGAQVDGYCADLTRTLVLGTADERQRTVYELVRDAQRHARSTIRAGMTGTDADGLARAMIAARGFGDAFGHSLGHGLGLEVHEAPRVSATNKEPLPDSAVVTVEPGLYFPGWGGVRIEDDVHLAAAGPVLLSGGETELREFT